MDNEPFKKNVLIVEDELLIAHAIKNMLLPNYKVDDLVVSYEDAISVLQNKPIDIALLDVNLSGIKSGVDVSKFINNNTKIPFIFLTAISNEAILDELIKCKPSAYLSKPINKPDLYTAMHLALNKKSQVDRIKIKSGTSLHILDLSKLLYIESDHIYCNITTVLNEDNFAIRSSLNDIMAQANPHLERINRSTVINPRFIKHQTFSKITMKNNKVFTLSKIYK